MIDIDIYVVSSRVLVRVVEGILVRVQWDSHSMGCINGVVSANSFVAVAFSRINDVDEVYTEDMLTGSRPWDGKLQCAIVEVPLL